MGTLRTGLYPAGRLKIGAAILAAAETADVTLVQKRLDLFATAHTAYMGAHGVVEAAETLLRERQTRLDQRDAEQDEAVEEVARALVTDHQPRKNPFAAYNSPAPWAIRQLSYGEKAKAMHTLAGMLRADSTLSKATQRAAQTAEEAARRMEDELIPFDKLQTSLRTARDARAAAGKIWSQALGALKRAARAAADDGAPGLYVALFGRPKRAKNQQATGDTQHTADTAGTAIPAAQTPTRAG